MAFGVAFTLLSVVASWNFYVHNGPWRTDQLRAADAVVTDVDAGRKSDRATVEFTDDGGRPIVADTRVLENSVDEGDRVRVEYTQGEQPLVRVRDAWRPAYVVFGAYAAAAFLACLVATCTCIVRGRDPRPDVRVYALRGVRGRL